MKIPALRPYQRSAVVAGFDYFKAGNKGNPLIVAPTGSGKSWILAGFIAEAYRLYPEEKILVLTHTKEIIDQNLKILQKLLPPHLIGVYSVGLGYRQVRQFTIASIQSVYKKAELFQDVKLIIVDECHLVPPKGEGRYLTFLGEMKHAKVLGMTATPFRLGTGLLTDNHIFDRIVYDIKLQTLIDLKQLVPLSTKATEYAIDTSGLKIVGGDYSKLELSDRVDRQIVTERIVAELIKFAGTFKSWLVFAIDIAHSEHIAAELSKHGIVAAAIHSKLDIDRTPLLELFKEGHIQALVSVETLTTGFDAPNVDLIVMMRPTQSPVLHVQMLGRGMRPYEGKEKCLVLDFAGNVSRLGPVDEVCVSKKTQGKKKGGLPMTKTCPTCKEVVAISRKNCPACGHEFKFKTKLAIVPDAGRALASEAPQVKIVSVKSVRFTKHHKAGKPPSMKVTYHCGPVTFYHEWVAFEHEGWPRRRAEQWWIRFANNEVPDSVDEALDRQSEISKPKELRVIMAGKYPEVIAK